MKRPIQDNVERLEWAFSVLEKSIVPLLRGLAGQPKQDEGAEKWNQVEQPAQAARADVVEAADDGGDGRDAHYQVVGREEQEDDHGRDDRLAGVVVAEAVEEKGECNGQGEVEQKDAQCAPPVVGPAQPFVDVEKVLEVQLGRGAQSRGRTLVVRLIRSGFLGGCDRWWGRRCRLIGQRLLGPTGGAEGVRRRKGLATLGTEMMMGLHTLAPLDDL